MKFNVILKKCPNNYWKILKSSQGNLYFDRLKTLTGIKKLSLKSIKKDKFKNKLTQHSIFHAYLLAVLPVIKHIKTSYKL